MEQGGTADKAFNAIDGTINNTTTTTIFSYRKPFPSREMVEDSWHTEHNLICL